MSALLLWLALGCACQRGHKPVEVLVPELPPAQEPAGRVVDGWFVDSEHGLRIQVLPGWRAEPGAWGDALRARLVHEDTGAIVELWLFEARLSAPAPREGCDWAFVDQGPYSTIPQVRVPVIGTCTPEAPDAPRVMAWLLPHGSVTWQLELHLPPERFSDARRAGEAVLRTTRL